DDNENGFSDCADNQCAGKICGVTEVSEDNGIKIEKRDLYCISGVCQLKEYIEEDIEAVCGNHICEEGEAESCQRDCSACKVWDAIECSGNVIFSGEDVNGCPLEPICIEDVEYCEVADDCPRSLCGKSECVENECVVAELTECQEVECVDGQKKATRCESGEIIFDGICLDGIWRNLFISCPEGVGSVCGNDECENSLGEDSYNCPTDCEWTCGNGFCEPFEGGKCDEDCDSSVSDKKDYGEDCSSDDECMYYKCRVGRCSNGNGVGEGCEEDWECESEGCVDGVCSEGGQIIEVEVGIECEVREDCGGVDDVCSNGKCVTLPKVVEVVEKDVDGLEVEVVENDEEVVEEVEEDIENSEESIEEIIEESDEKVVSSGDDPLGPEEDESIDSISITGGTIFNFFEMFLIGITGSVVDEGEGTVEEEPVSQEDDPTGSEEVVEEEPVSQEDDLAVPEENEGEVSGDGGSSEGDYVGGEVCPDEGSPPEVEDNCRYEKVYDDRGCVNGYDVECGEYESGDYEMDWDGGDWEDDKRDEKREWEEERRKREKTCPDECKNVCEEKLSSERYDVERCAEECVHVCVDAGLEEFEDYFVENHFRKEEKGVFVFGGQCRTAQQKTEGFVYFNGWGEPFDDIQPMKQKYYSGGEADWCKWDLENLKKQREEIEKGFNQEFAVWFFEKYLINSAEDWEQHVSGIFELYWNNVDNQREMAHRMQCIGVDDVGEIMDYNLINISYSSEYGSLEYWEEVRTVKVPGMDEKVTIISPYMKVWIFPSKEFIMYEMQKSMKAHEFPGSPEEKSERGNEEGLTAEERAKVKEDNGFMKKIRSVAGKYGGNLGVNVNFVDPATGELVFNVYAQVSEGDILIMKPMLPNESDAEDVRIEIDFDKVYELIDMEERDMRGAEVESPPWDRRPKKVGMVKSFVNEIKMYFKVMGIINSAKVYPESAKRDVRDLFKTFFQMMISMDDKGGDRDEGDEKEMGENPWEEKSVVSGEVVRGF
ncbi:hypothetical protein KAI32_02620, partial [Candidatus Pacearchaeota archaeon]|nr:hypothetical protein [Candidatus Pacearchaeota archaeon]